MARAFLTICAAVIFVGIAQAPPAVAVPNNPFITWQGSVTLLSKTAACNAVPGFDPGILAYSIFRPRLDPAEPNSALTVTFPRSTLIFTRASGENQMHGAGSYSGIWISERVTAKSSAGAYNFAMSPAGAITTAIPFVTITGTITNWGAIAGCTVTFRGSYERRPN